MSEPVFRSQCESLLLAKRWAKAVDFGSPMTAWTPAMLEAYGKAGGDKMAAQALLSAEQANKPQDPRGDVKPTGGRHGG